MLRKYSEKSIRKGDKMTQAQTGDSVKVHYTGKLDDGTIFDSSADREPLEFTIGERQVIPGFEDAVVGMSPDESKTITILADKAYGPHNPEMVVTVERDRFPEHLEPQIGQQLQMRQEQGQVIVVMVTDVSESQVSLDANHPLAGKDLTFDIQLVAIT